MKEWIIENIQIVAGLAPVILIFCSVWLMVWYDTRKPKEPDSVDSASAEIRRHKAKTGR
jgi:hypothetical protein